MAKPMIREIPLAMAKCPCREYVVSMYHLVPPCRDCGLTPEYAGETAYRLVVETPWNPFVDPTMYADAS